MTAVPQDGETGSPPTRTTSTTWRFAVLLTATSAYLDAYTLTTRDVFFSAQTGNVVLMMTALARLNFGAVGARFWSLVFFLVGCGFATHLRRRWLHSRMFPLRWMLVADVALLVVLGFVPASAPSAIVIAPLSLMAGMFFELFRKVGPHAYLPVATTGNLVRFTESLHGAVVEHDPEARRALPVHASIVAVFAGGAGVGALATHLLGIHAIWIAAAALLVVLLFFVLDDRAERGVERDLS